MQERRLNNVIGPTGEPIGKEAVRLQPDGREDRGLGVGASGADVAGHANAAAHANAAVTAAPSRRRDGVAMLLTPREVEAELRLGRTRTYQLLRSGEIPSLRVGRAIRVSRAALELWISDRSTRVS
jgi:excisionase family DNA binding protein